MNARRRMATLGLCCVALLSAAPPAHAATCPAGSVAFSGAASNDWKNPANWTGGAAPTATDVACIAPGQTVHVANSGGSAVADSIVGGGDVVVENGYSGGLTLTGTAASNIGNLTIGFGSVASHGSAGVTVASYTQTSGSYDGAAPLTVTGSFDLQGGGLGATEAVAITQSVAAGGGTFKVDGSGSPSLFHGTIATNAPATITNTNLDICGSGASPAVLTSSEPVTIGPGTYGGCSDQRSVLNAPGLSTTGTTVLPWIFHQTGTTATAWSPAGSTEVARFDQDAGLTLTVPSGATFSTHNGTVSGTVDGAGRFQQTGDYTGITTFPAGANLAASDVLISGGLLRIASGASFQPSASLTLDPVGNSGPTLESAVDAATGRLTMTGGTLNGPMTLSVSGDVDWQGGQISETAAKNVNLVQTVGTGAGTFRIVGSGSPELGGGTITTDAPVTVTNTHLSAYQHSDVAPVLTATRPVTFAAGTYSGGPSFTLIAPGVITSAATTLPWTLHQTAALTPPPSLGGSLSVDTLDQESGAALGVSAGITFSTLHGTVRGAVTGAGTFEQAGVGNAGGGTTVVSGAHLGAANLRVTGGMLTVQPGASLAPSQSITIAAVCCTTPAVLASAVDASTGNLTMTRGELRGPMSLAVSGDIDLQGGSISLVGGQLVNITQHVTPGAGTFKVDGTGTVTIGGGTITTDAPATITNTNLQLAANSGGPAVITASQPITFGPGTWSANGGSFNSPGIITTGQVELQTRFHQTAAPGATTSLGGPLRITTFDQDSDAAFTIPPGGSFSIGGGTVGGTITGHGTLQVNSGNLVVRGSGAVTPDGVSVTTYTVATTGVTVDPGGLLAPGKALTLTSAPFACGRVAINSDNDLVIPADGALTIGACGGLTVNGSGFVEIDGALNVAGKLTMAGGGMLATAGTTTVTSDPSTGGAITFAAPDGAAATWLNTGSASLDHANVTGPNRASEQDIVLNAGTITAKGSDDGVSTLPRVVNDGVVEVDRGELRTDGMTQTPDGTMRVRIAGTAAKTQYGTFTTSGRGYSGGGTITAVFEPGYTPAIGDSFRVVQSGCCAGDVDRVTAQNLPNGDAVTGTRGSGTFDVAVAAAPAARRATTVAGESTPTALAPSTQLGTVPPTAVVSTARARLRAAVRRRARTRRVHRRRVHDRYHRHGASRGES